jgi:hypothetical protein
VHSTNNIAYSTDYRMESSKYDSDVTHEPFFTTSRPSRAVLTTITAVDALPLILGLHFRPRAFPRYIIFPLNSCTIAMRLNSKLSSIVPHLLQVWNLRRNIQLVSIYGIFGRLFPKSRVLAAPLDVCCSQDSSSMHMKRLSELSWNSPWKQH